jgi:hypothetical protein
VVVWRLNIVWKTKSKTRKTKVTLFDFKFLSYCWVFGGDKMVCGCYNGVGEVFLNWNSFKIGFFLPKESLSWFPSHYYGARNVDLQITCCLLWRAKCHQLIIFLKKGHPTILKKQAQTNEPGLKGPLTLIGFSLHKFGVDEMVCKVREHIFIY